MPTLGLFEIIVAVVVGVGVLLTASIKVARFLRRIGRFLNVFFGEPASYGEEARPSIPERLAIVEKRTEQLEPNGGTSLRDTVTRIDRTLAEHIAQCTPPRRWRRNGG